MVCCIEKSRNRNEAKIVIRKRRQITHNYNRGAQKCIEKWYFFILSFGFSFLFIQFYFATCIQSCSFFIVICFLCFLVVVLFNSCNSQKSTLQWATISTLNPFSRNTFFYSYTWVRLFLSIVRSTQKKEMKRETKRRKEEKSYFNLCALFISLAFCFTTFLSCYSNLSSPYFIFLFTNVHWTPPRTIFFLKIQSKFCV